MILTSYWVLLLLETVFQAIQLLHWVSIHIIRCWITVLRKLISMQLKSTWLLANEALGKFWIDNTLKINLFSQEQSFNQAV